jgi:peptide/nickel transport system permease protein
MATLASEPLASLELKKSAPSESLWRVTLRRFLRQRTAMVGLFILGVLTFTAIFAPVIAPYDPLQQLIGIEDVTRRDPPCIHALGCPADQPQHLMGLDGNVRDMFSRMVYGARYSLLIGFATVSFAIVIGTLLGAVAGYAGGWVEDVIMRLMDVLLAFPSLLLAIAIVVVLNPRLEGLPDVPGLPGFWGMAAALLAVGIVSIPAYARIIRASVLSIKELEYIEASRALGANHTRVLFNRILPNSMTPLIVQATLGIAGAILETAALSFLGFGAQPPAPEWGAMLGAERAQIFSAPHLVFFPGLAISITVLAWNLVGDGLRDALDPRLMR